jgi:hypothetical protein
MFIEDEIRYATLDVHTLIITPPIQLFSVFHDFSYAVEPNIVMVEENGIGGVMVSMLVSSAVDCVFATSLCSFFLTLCA